MNRHWLTMIGQRPPSEFALFTRRALLEISLSIGFGSGFIEFIVEPSLTVMGDLLERILLPRTTPSSTASAAQRDSISEEKTAEASGKFNAIRFYGAARWN
jgi:hypothetical protein